MKRRRMTLCTLRSELLNKRRFTYLLYDAGVDDQFSRQIQSPHRCCPAQLAGAMGEPAACYIEGRRSN